MKRVYFLPLLAIFGLVIAALAIIQSNKPPEVQTRPILQLQPSFESYVIGTGIVEATSGNISIGGPVSGIVTEIYVRAGDYVTTGDPLFKIDDRELQAELLVATAKVEEATAHLQGPRHRLERAEELHNRDANAISEQNLSDLIDENAVAEASLAMAEALLEQVNLNIDLRTVRARVDGEILRITMRAGEFIESGSATAPMMLLGSNGEMALRVDIDEHDAWRIQPQAEATAYLRGHPEVKVALQYFYTEPEIIPKVSLTGQSTERTDSRVLQVVYKFEHGSLPIYVGQQMDAYIQVLSSTSLQ